MIRVSLPPPPPRYEAEVHRPGLAFLATTPNPTRNEWGMHRYWSNVHSDLYRWHKGVCSYCASWTPRTARRGGLDHTSIDHFVPKSRNTRLAYTWENFRLVRAKLNHRKADFQDVIDPLVIQNGWFQLSFTTFLIKSDSSLAPSIRTQVDSTIDRLELNRDRAYVNERARAVYKYSAGTLPFGELERLYPFIALEIQAQNFDSVMKSKVQAVLAKRPWLAV